MKALPLLAVFALLLALAPARALDLTPHFPSRVADTPIRWVHFVDGENRYVLTVPLGVEMSEADGGILFRFQGAEDASLAIRKSPLTPALVFSDSSLDAYRQAALALAPAGASNLVIEKESSVSIPLANSTSYRFLISFKLPGRSFQMAVTFGNVDAEQQIMLITLATKDTFNSAEALSAAILSTWHLSLPGENLSDPPTS